MSRLEHLNIRQATVSDTDAIIAIYAERRDFIHRAVSRGEAHVAEISGRVIGYSIFNYAFYDNGFIWLLHVAREHRRRGIGAALMRYLRDLCETPKLFTSTNLSNHPMQDLLAELGWEMCGVIHHLDEGDPELVYVSLGADSQVQPPRLD